MTRFAILAVLASLAAPSAAAPGDATLTIRVDNVRNAQGRIHVDLCDQRHFLGDACPVGLAVPAQSPVTTIVVRDLPPGHYAVQLFHDENMNDRADRNFLGIPREGIAFSRDAPLRLSGPRWADAEVAVAGGEAITVRMRYLLGASGPARR